MTHEELRRRTLQFAVSVAKAVAPAADRTISRNAATQLIRSSASVGANYRAVGVARSRADFLAKLALVLEEADECVYWLDYLESLKVLPPSSIPPLADEARQLARIFGASRRTARQKGGRSTRLPGADELMD